MNFKPAYLATALAVVTCMASASSEAASPVIRGRFSYDGVATCQQPAVQNFHFHGEGTAVLFPDRTGNIDLRSGVSGRNQFNALLAHRTEAAGGSATLHAVGRV